MNHSLDINLIPGGVVPVVHMSQGDAIPSGLVVGVQSESVSADDDYVLVIPIDDGVKKNDNTNSDNQSDTE